MLNGLSNVLNNTVIQETSFLLMVSFFSISVQDCLSMNNWKLSNPLFFYTNFIFLILLTHSSLTNSPTALLLFFFFQIWCVLIISSLPLCTGFFLKMICGPFLQCHFLPFEYIHSHPSPLSMSVHYMMWSQKKWTPQEDMQVCLFYCFSLLFFHLSNLS